MDAYNQFHLNFASEIRYGKIITLSEIVHHNVARKKKKL